MFSIKESLAQCLECPLYDAPSAILETNCESFDDVEIVFVAENPGKVEVEKEVPLVGNAGQVFRKYFNLYGINKRKYLLTNTVLCQTITKDGGTGNPTDDVATRCKVNCFDIIRNCNPKLIVLMGTTPAREFGFIEKGGITSIRGNMFKWEGYDVLIMTHPSFILRRRGGEDEINFANDIKHAGEFIGMKFGSFQSSENVVLDVSNAYFYKIPDKFYTEDYYLVDVQYIGKNNEILYIFLDKDNNKVYHRENDDYFCYQMDDESKAKYTVPYQDLKQVRSRYRQKHRLNPKLTYEGDVKLPIKHAIDYYLTRTAPEPVVQFRTMFLDIETSSKDGLSYSPVEEANDIITIIGFYYDGKHTAYVLDPKFLDKKSTKEITIEDVIICKTEKELLNLFIKDFKKIDPLFLTGWFVDGYDMPYIINRCEKNGINPGELSKFGDVEFDLNNNKVHIAGVIMTDLLFLYREYTFVKEESYSLDYIANKYLGEGKLGKGYNFTKMFRDNPDEAILYNRQDVDILPRLDAIFRHIHFQNETRKICKTTFDATRTTLGMLDSLLVSYLKPMGISVRSANIGEKTEKYKGAYVKEPDVGIHEYICDFDFSSLYPSIIMTYNIGVNTFVMKFANQEHGYDLLYEPENLPDNIEVIIDPSFSAIKKTTTKENLFEIIEKEKLIYTINGCFFRQHDKEKSYYSDIVDMLMKARKVYKKEMFEAKMNGDSEKEKILDAKQTALKVLANSLYGGIGNNAFRFYNVDCAKSITLSGQEATKNAIIHVDTFIDSLNGNEYQPADKLAKNEMFGENHIERKINHVVTGDTDSLFVTYENIIKDIEDTNIIMKTVVEYNSRVQEFLNNNVISNIVKNRNVDLSYNRLELKNELVIKRGYFLAKKRYAIRVALHEGKETDEITEKGLETRRSDYPSYTKTKLEELLHMILTSDVVKAPKILKYAKEVEIDILNKIIEGVKEVARPVSYTKKIEDYKTIPQGVRGMENWNILEYETFFAGSRGYLFKLKGIDIDKAPEEIIERFDEHFRKTGRKLDVIVVPENVNRIPEYYITDDMEMLRFAWVDRYKLLLEPILKIEKKLLAFENKLL